MKVIPETRTKFDIYVLFRVLDIALTVVTLEFTGTWYLWQNLFELSKNVLSIFSETKVSCNGLQKFISSVLSLWTCKIMRSFNLSCLIVERKYVLILHRVLNRMTFHWWNWLPASPKQASTLLQPDSKSRSLLVIPRMYSNTSLKTASSFFPSDSNIVANCLNWHWRLASWMSLR